jgi:DNA-binding NarL/FixJ family response regulator
MNYIRVLLADDHPIVRTGIQSMLAKAPDIIVVAEVDNGMAVLAEIEALAPDIRC